MKNTLLFLALIIYSAITGCSAVVIDPSSIEKAPTMSGIQARAAIDEAMNHVHFAIFFDRAVRKITYSPKGLHIFTIKPNGQPLEYLLAYSAAEKLRLVKSAGDYLAEAPGTTADLPWNFVWKDERPAREFVRAAHFLATSTRKNETNAPSSVVAFQKTADEYHNSPAQNFPDEANRFKVLADRSFKEKNYLDAIEHYESALTVAPWWPEGRFNRALLLGQQQYFAQASAEMKKYLLLIPNAPNAKEANEKIYYWESQLRLASPP